MTKDEFVSKYHTQKPLRFEPPTWEEFLATRDVHTFANWNCGGIFIVMEEDIIGNRNSDNRFIVDCGYKQYSIPYSNVICGWDMRVECYYKALEIAKKWFLGEEV